MSPDKLKALTLYLSEYITPHKKALFEEVLSKRTRYLTVVLEDIYQSHNASAVVRSCDCFGIQDLHVIENTNDYTVNPDITLGSSKWVNIIHFRDGKDNTRDCLLKLKEQGYRLIATSPDPDAMSIHTLRLEQPTAMLFGTELTGLSETAFELADEKVRIPMYGFTESFNISVSAALVLQILREKLENGTQDFRLAEPDREEILLTWYKKVIKRSDKYIEDFESRWTE